MHVSASPWEASPTLPILTLGTHLIKAAPVLAAATPVHLSSPRCGSRGTPYVTCHCSPNQASTLYVAEGSALSWCPHTLGWSLPRPPPGPQGSLQKCLLKHRCFTHLWHHCLLWKGPDLLGFVTGTYHSARSSKLLVKRVDEWWSGDAYKHPSVSKVWGGQPLPTCPPRDLSLLHPVIKSEETQLLPWFPQLGNLYSSHRTSSVLH